MGGLRVTTRCSFENFGPEKMEEQVVLATEAVSIALLKLGKRKLEVNGQAVVRRGREVSKLSQRKS